MSEYWIGFVLGFLVSPFVLIPAGFAAVHVYWWIQDAKEGRTP